jgi:hypothetical protein
MKLTGRMHRMAEHKHIEAHSTNRSKNLIKRILLK